MDCNDKHYVRSYNVHSAGGQHGRTDDRCRPHSKSIHEQGEKNNNQFIELILRQKDELILRHFKKGHLLL